MNWKESLSALGVKPFSNLVGDNPKLIYKQIMDKEAELPDWMEGMDLGDY